jgi:hypothetical protein
MTGKVRMSGTAKIIVSYWRNVYKSCTSSAIIDRVEILINQISVIFLFAYSR